VTIETALPPVASPSPPMMRRIGFIGPLLVLLAVASAVVTFLVLTGLTPYEPTQNVFITLMSVNAAFVAALLINIGIEVFGLLRARWHGQAGAALHIRVIALFSIVAALPAILVAAVASITLDRGLDNWFSTRTRTIIETSLTVANAYVQEQGRLIRAESLAMATDINRAWPVYSNDKPRFLEFLKAQGTIRGLPVSMLLDREMNITDRAAIPGYADAPLPPPEVMTDAQTQDSVIIAPGSRNLIGAVVKLRAYEDRYLFVARPFDPRIAEYVRRTSAGAAEFKALEERRLGFQVAFALMYVMIALIILLSAIWIGLAFANRLVDPIRRLINAATEVAGGNLYVRVPTDHREADLAMLGETFNSMTDTLRTQRNELVGANNLLDRRRRFMEAVLSGVSTGVIGVDDHGIITVINPLAERLIGDGSGELVGKDLAVLAPELSSLLADAFSGRIRQTQGQISLQRKGKERTINVRVASETAAIREHGFVVTLDDITDLVTAQRTSAWADVARRIAHEIKNPLTPIQLSAERIKRKYGKVITEDREVFDQCTDTIVRQVDDIRKMVDEFSSFARMPKPAIEREDLSETVKQVVFLMRIGNPDTVFDVEMPDEPLLVPIDRRLISQAVTNVLKNATEAIAAVPEAERATPRIVVRLRAVGEEAVIEVIDNGIGLPVENRTRLLEPYVTTREKGTGLGLAIVGKIMEDHGGSIELLDAPAVAEGGRGAMMRLRIPLATPDHHEA
jgi:two-component system nitrogen regulation sensor histidine kinase NtrY